jgi:hypothetical protein
MSDDELKLLLAVAQAIVGDFDTPRSRRIAISDLADKVKATSAKKAHKGTSI